MRFFVASLISLRSRSALDTLTTGTFRSLATSFMRIGLTEIDSHDTLGHHHRNTVLNADPKGEIPSTEDRSIASWRVPLHSALSMEKSRDTTVLPGIPSVHTRYPRGSPPQLPIPP